MTDVEKIAAIKALLLDLDKLRAHLLKKRFLATFDVIEAEAAALHKVARIVDNTRP